MTAWALRCHFVFLPKDLPIMTRSVAARAAAALVVPLLLAACTSTGTSSTSASSSSTAAASASPSPSDPNAGLLTGAKLKPLLVTDMPPGFTLDPSGSRDSGTFFQLPSSPSAAATPDCTQLDGTAWVELGGGGAVSFAQNDYLDSTKNEIAQEIDVYQGTAAQTVMTRLQQVFAACATYKTNDQGTTVTVHVATTAATDLGPDAIKAVVTSPSWQGDTTMVAARVNNAVVTAFYSSSDEGKTGLVVGLVTQILQQLKTAS
jgi:hypothetical protein